MDTVYWLLAACGGIVIAVVLSFLVEALRSQPQIPDSLYWSKDVPVRYQTVNGMRIRYIRTGRGPNLVLLHTLRTQLDIFQKIIPRLAGHFTVYALDYPGHGFSDIPKTDYTPDLFVSTVAQFLDDLDIEHATLAGISIGGTISLYLAAAHNPRVDQVIAINLYDYANGLGAARGNLVAWFIFNASRIPVLGDTIMRFRIPLVETIIFRGGVATPRALPGEFLQQCWDSGKRKGHYRGFINLIRHAREWDLAHRVYGQIRIPVLLVYGERDWSYPSERKRTLSEIPGAVMETVNNGGHFLSLDQPEAVIHLIRQPALTPTTH